MSTDQVSSSAIEALPLGRLGVALRGENAYLVGGVTRSMFGAEPLAGDDIDIAVDAELGPLLDRLDEVGFRARRHDRFGTATIELDDGTVVDLARTRSEHYEGPGELPVVAPAGIDEDLARRDFTINAIAVALDEPHRVLDPFEGRRDLRDGVLRVLHRRSFVDDPTRAIRAARYAGRLDLSVDPETERLLRATRLGSTSDDRRLAELRRLARERAAADCLARLGDWGLLELPPDALRLVAAVVEESRLPEWSEIDADQRADAVLLAAVPGDARRRQRALALREADPQAPSHGEQLASPLEEHELLLASAAGAGWIRDYVSRWRPLRLAISGADLLAAGIPEGPRIGRALAEVRRMVLDGELGGGEEEQLRAALASAEA